ncbi:MAG TPA: preprotein translocase subunit YajC [Phycisphaerae bacterium]|nr:preprotein translocase subunit YajC [Phycisphaerae bacterium]
MHELISLPLGQMHATTSTTGPAVSAPVAESSAATTQTGITIQPTTQDAPKAQSPWAGVVQFAPLILIVLAFYLFMFRGQKKTEKTRKEMLAQMKKGDEVMTIGGMVARVVSIDDDEVVLKIDESANVKARYKKSAIQQVLTAEDKAK